MDPPLNRDWPLQLVEQRDGGSGIDSLDLDQGAVEGLQVECRVQIEALTPRGSPQRHLVPLADPAMDRRMVLGVHHVGEVDRLVGGQAVQQRLVSRDEGACLPSSARAGRLSGRGIRNPGDATTSSRRNGCRRRPTSPRYRRHLATVRQSGSPRCAESSASCSRLNAHFGHASRTSSTHPGHPLGSALEPGSYRVVVEVENFRHFDAAQTVVQQKHGIRPPRTPWISLG